MQESDKRAFRDLISDCLAFYKQDANTFVYRVWWGAMQGFSLEQVSKAIHAHVIDAERGQFPPKPADIVRLLQGTKTDKALLAWGKVAAAMSDIGAYRDVQFDDPVIHACITDLGGWPKLCRTSMDDLSYLAHRFAESYRAYDSKRGEIELPLKLAGDRGSDEDYAKRGLPPPKPVLIGNVGANLLGAS